MSNALPEAPFGTLLDEILDANASDRQIENAIYRLADITADAQTICAAVNRVMSQAQVFETRADTIDVCGTGGDHGNTLNVSTAVAFVAASCGARVAKHGNRAASSRSGATDVLDALNISTGASSETALRQLETIGLTFLNASNYHPALARLAPFRKALGRPTIFNLIGPLLNPFRVRRQLLGVHSPGLVPIMAEAALRLGRDLVWVVCSGTDELSVSDENTISVLEDGNITARTLDPRQLNLMPATCDSLAGGDPSYNATALAAMLGGARGAYRDTVILNAAATLVIAGCVANIPEGIAMAAEAIDSGAALAKLRCLQGWSDG